MVKLNDLKGLNEVLSNKSNWVFMGGVEAEIIEIEYKGKVTSVYYGYDPIYRKRVYFYVTDILGEPNLSPNFFFKKVVAKSLEKEMRKW